MPVDVKCRATGGGLGLDLEIAAALQHVDPLQAALLKADILAVHGGFQAKCDRGGAAAG